MTTDELWATLKFRLMTFESVEDIEDEIERMVRAWAADIDQPSADAFRTRLYALVREGLEEDRRSIRAKRN